MPGWGTALGARLCVRRMPMCEVHAYVCDLRHHCQVLALRREDHRVDG